MILLVKNDLDRHTMRPKFDLTGVRMHDLQITTSPFHVPETPILTTMTSGIYTHRMWLNAGICSDYNDWVSVDTCKYDSLFGDQLLATRRYALAINMHIPALV